MTAVPSTPNSNGNTHTGSLHIAICIVILNLIKEKQFSCPYDTTCLAAGVNIMDFVKQFNDRTANQAGTIIPVVITVYKDKSFEFITKEPPMAVLIKKAAKVEKGSGKPNKEKVATITMEQVEEIAKTKMPDLNAASLETAMSMVEGTARSMGVVVKK